MPQKRAIITASQERERKEYAQVKNSYGRWLGKGEYHTSMNLKTFGILCERLHSARDWIMWHQIQKGRTVFDEYKKSCLKGEAMVYGGE